jgi:hypothetical protein
MSNEEPWTKEEYDRLYKEVAEALKPDPPKPKPTSAQKAQDRWSSPPDEVILQQAAKSAEAQLQMAERWRDRRQERMLKEMADWQAEAQDPRIKHQRELDAWWQRQRDLKAALYDDEYVEIAGFRERRYRTTAHRGKGDPDYGL